MARIAVDIDRDESSERRPPSAGLRIDVAICLFLIGAGFVTFHTSDIEISADLAKYMSYALNLARGDGYLDFDGKQSMERGPGLSLMISWCFSLLGISPWSAFWVVRVFCVLNPVAVYALGKTLFSRRVGVSASILVLTSYTVSHWSYRHVDAIWPFFMLVSIVCLYAGLTRERPGQWALSGLLAATSFLVKESALLFFPLPIMLLVVIPEFRSRKNLLGMLIWSGAVLVGIAVWYFGFHAGGRESSGVERATMLLGLGADPAHLVTFYLRGLLDYYGAARGVSSLFSVSSLFLIGWSFALLRSLRKDRGSRVLVSCLLLLSPFMAFVAQFSMRPGQLVILFFLNYLVLAHALCCLAEWVTLALPVRDATARRRTVMYAVVLVVSPIVLYQSFTQREADRGGVTFLQRSLYSAHTEGKENAPRRVRGAMSRELNAATAWLEKAVPPDAVIMGGSVWENRGLFLLSEGRLKLRDFPLVRLKYQMSDTYHPLLIWEGRKYSVEEFDIPPSKDLLFLSTQVDRASRSPDFSSLWALYESHLIQKIVAINVEYVLVGPVFNFLAEYFETSHAFTRIASSRAGRFQVFKVEPDLLPSAHPIFVTKRTTSCLKSLKKEQAASFDYLRSFLREKVGLTESDIASLVSGRLAYRFESARFRR